MKLPTDPSLGPLLSVVILLLILSIAFLVATLPFSAVLHSNPGVIGGVISALVTLLGVVIQLRGRLDKGP